MNIAIIVFNLFFYTVTFILLMLGLKDPSVSLGYGMAILVFWVLSTIILIFLLAKKLISPRSVPDKVGVFTATPLLLIIVIAIIRSGIFT